MHKVVSFKSYRFQSRISTSLKHPQSANYSSFEEDKSLNYLNHRHKLKSSKWPNGSLGPIDTLNPQFPLPGNVGFNNDKRLRFKETIINTKGFVNAVNSLPLRREDHYLTTLIQTFNVNEFNENTDKVTPLVADIPKNLQAFDSDEELSAKIEYQLHRCPHLLLHSLKKYYPNLSNAFNLTTITHLHRTENPSNLVTEEMIEEREKIAQQFIAKAIELCAALRELNYWADFINPYTGTPYLAPHYNGQLEKITETHPSLEQLGFEIDQLGCCRIVRHKVWGSNIFIGLVFTDAPKSHPVLAEFNHLDSIS